MTEGTSTTVDTAAVAKQKDPARPLGNGVDAALVDRLVEQARAAGLRLTGDGGLLQQLTRRVLESALEGEISDHLGYDKGDPAGKNGGNSRNGVRAKTVQYQRDRVRQRADPTRRPRPRPLPQRTGRPQVCLPGRDEPGPHRPGSPAMDHAVETRAERLRNRLRRTPHRSPQVAPIDASYTVRLTDPTSASSERRLHDSRRTSPVLDLAATVVGVPLLATLAAWLLAGREPETFARRRMD